MKAALRAIVYPLLIVASITIVGWEPDTSYLEPEMWRPSIGNSGIVSVSADTTYYEMMWHAEFGEEVSVRAVGRGWRLAALTALWLFATFVFGIISMTGAVENPNGFNRPEGP